MPTTLRLRTAVAFFTVCLTAAACSKQPSALKADRATERTIRTGSLVGGESRYGAHAWLGIPYAEPPIGDFRWRAPLPKKPWTDQLAAVRHGAPCLQYPSPFGGVDGAAGEPVGQEDCLTLDVFAPPMTAGAIAGAARRLPVMVWIHGGANSIGAASGYDGGNLAVSQNVIVVNLQYRLGPLGWFRHAALRAAGGDDIEQSGNFATLDQILALRWVQENIAAFGGDPENVTVFGESAGARNTLMLLLSPLAQGLFHRAIVQSGFAGCGSAEEAENLVEEGGHSKSSEETLLALLAKDFEVDRDAAKRKRAEMTAEQVRAYLRGKTGAEFLAAFKPSGKRILLYPQLFDDGAVIPRGCSGLFAEGRWNRMPVILGANRDEARLFMFGNPKFVTRTFGVIPKLLIDEQEYVIASDYASRAIRLAGTDQLAAEMAAHGAQVYVYRFDWDELPTMFGVRLPTLLGAAHGFEIPFVFGHFYLGKEAERLFPEETRASRTALSDVMMAYWGAFARSGAPAVEADGLPAWHVWQANGAPPRRIVFDTPEDGGVRMEEGADSLEKLVADIESDKRLPLATRCALLQQVAWRSSGFDRDSYERREECRPFPFDARTEL